MRWIGHMEAARLAPGIALRICPDGVAQAADAIVLSSGDELFIAPPAGAYLRSDVLEAVGAEATVRDVDGRCWRLRRCADGEPTANVQLAGAFEDWIVERVVVSS